MKYYHNTTLICFFLFNFFKIDIMRENLINEILFCNSFSEEFWN